jgi:hypothetical protein
MATFSGEVKAPALLVLDSPSQWSAALAKLSGQRVRVEIKRLMPKRSLDANAYLWVCYTILSEWCGHEPEELHEVLKAKFLTPHPDSLPSGVTLDFYPSTRDLDSGEMAAYTDKVRKFAAENGVDIPSPDEWRAAGGYR